MGTRNRQIGRGVGGAGRLGMPCAGRLGIVAAVLVWSLGLVGGLAPASPALAQPGMTTPRELQGIDPETKLGEQVPLDAVLMNDAGEMVKLGDYFGSGPLATTPDGRGKPAILALVYYDCPIVCPLTMERLRQAMNQIEYIVGEDFNVIVVSIDHTNTPEMSLREKMASLVAYNRTPSDAVKAGWAYHTASQGNIQRIADAVGYKFNFIADAGEYAHAPGLILLTPEGRVARYIDGVDYVVRAGEIQLGLVEASQGEISATIMDRLVLWCFHYDASKGSYTLQAKRVMKVGGVISMLGIAGLVLVLRGQEKRRARRRAASAVAAAAPDHGPDADAGPPRSTAPASRSAPPARPPRPRQTPMPGIAHPANSRRTTST